MPGERGFAELQQRVEQSVFVARLIAQRLSPGASHAAARFLLIFAVLEILPGDVATRILGRDATR